MHGVPMPAPYSTPLNALYSAGVTRLKITSALAGAMRMSAKPPVSLPWRGLSPRGRDTPASRRAGHARACPEGRAVWSRHGHPTHEHLEFRFACTIARGSGPWHGVHERMECSIAGTHAEWSVQDWRWVSGCWWPVRPMCVPCVLRRCPHVLRLRGGTLRTYPLPLRCRSAAAPLALRARARQLAAVPGG